MLGMSLLVCDTSFDLLISSVLYHSKRVDKIVCIANNPSKLLIKILNFLEQSVPNFEVYGIVYEPISLDLQVRMVNAMVYQLSLKGCKWVINCDDDEFYLGDIRASIKMAEENNCNVLYQNGFCFYSTELDPINLNPVRRMRYRDPAHVDYEFRKAIHQTENFYSVTPGNHWVQFSGTHYKEIKDESLFIYHYTYRKKYLFPHLKNEFKIKSNQDVLDLQLVEDSNLINIFDLEDIP